MPRTIVNSNFKVKKNFKNIFLQFGGTTMTNSNLQQHIESLEKKVAKIDKLERELALLKTNGSKSLFHTLLGSKRRIIITAFTVILSISAILYAQQTANFTVFSAGTIIDADEVNRNFQIASPIGSITMHAAGAAPDGWLLCNGSEVSRTVYSELYAIIGTTFGTGDGASTFNLPDFRGVFPKGAGITGRAAGRDASGNYYSTTLGTYSQDKMQGHYHSLNKSDYFMPWGNSPFNYSWGGSAGNWPFYTVDNSADPVSSPKSDGTHGAARTGYTTEPQNLGVNFIIKY